MLVAAPWAWKMEARSGSLICDSQQGGSLIIQVHCNHWTELLGLSHVMSPILWSHLAGNSQMLSGLDPSLFFHVKYSQAGTLRCLSDNSFIIRRIPFQPFYFTILILYNSADSRKLSCQGPPVALTSTLGQQTSALTQLVILLLLSALGAFPDLCLPFTAVQLKNAG